MTITSKDSYVSTTREALENEFVNDNWQERLLQCVKQRVDADFEYAAHSRHYRRQTMTKYYENDTLVAFIIEYTRHDNSTFQRINMLLIDGVRHIASQ